MESQNYNETEITARQRGDSLEMAVEHILKIANFKTERNVFIAKYEIDVKATIGDRTIIIECKNYQNSNLTIRNLIHQWNSKNQLIRAHKVIIVLAGLKIKESDHELASQLDMELWSQDDLTDLFNLSLDPDKLRNRLLDKISLRPITIAERYREEITYLVIKPLLSKKYYSEESLHAYFNHWLRAHILTELEMSTTTREERANHIELFEGSKTKKIFLAIKKKRNQVDYWNTVLNQIENSNILPQTQLLKYLSYMDGLLTEFNSQNRYFDSDDYYGKLRKLLSSRIQNAIFLDEICVFKIFKGSNDVEVNYLSDSNFSIRITRLNENEGNILNWILTSQSSSYFDEQSKLYINEWHCSSLKETVEKVYRVFTEYFNISTKHHVIDSNL